MSSSREDSSVSTKPTQFHNQTQTQTEELMQALSVCDADKAMRLLAEGAKPAHSVLLIPELLVEFGKWDSKWSDNMVALMHIVASLLRHETQMEANQATAERLQLLERAVKDVAKHTQYMFWENWFDDDLKNDDSGFRMLTTVAKDRRDFAKAMQYTVAQCELFAALFDAGANFRGPLAHGALRTACERQNRRVVSVLLDYGAHDTSVTPANWSCFELLICQKNAVSFDDPMVRRFILSDPHFAATRVDFWSGRQNTVDATPSHKKLLKAIRGVATLISADVAIGLCGSGLPCLCVVEVMQSVFAGWNLEATRFDKLWNVAKAVQNFDPSTSPEPKPEPPKPSSPLQFESMARLVGEIELRTDALVTSICARSCAGSLHAAHKDLLLHIDHVADTARTAAEQIRAHAVVWPSVLSRCTALVNADRRATDFDPAELGSLQKALQDLRIMSCGSESTSPKDNHTATAVHIRVRLGDAFFEFSREYDYDGEWEEGRVQAFRKNTPQHARITLWKASGRNKAFAMFGVRDLISRDWTSHISNLTLERLLVSALEPHGRVDSDYEPQKSENEFEFEAHKDFLSDFEEKHETIVDSDWDADEANDSSQSMRSLDVSEGSVSALDIDELMKDGE